MTFQDRLRLATNGITSYIGKLLWSWGIHPDSLTVAGFFVTAFGVYFIIVGQFQLAGIILIVGLPFDAVDGAVARAMNQPNRKFGGVLDSVLDRYADGFIFGGLILYYHFQNNTAGLILSLLALLGAYATSYVRSRAGMAGVETKVGLDRLIRVFIILAGLLIPGLLTIVVAALAIAGNYTAAQRLYYARQHLE